MADMTSSGDRTFKAVVGASTAAALLGGLLIAANWNKKSGRKSSSKKSKSSKSRKKSSRQSKKKASDKPQQKDNSSNAAALQQAQQIPSDQEFIQLLQASMQALQRGQVDQRVRDWLRTLVPTQFAPETRIMAARWILIHKAILSQLASRGYRIPPESGSAVLDIDRAWQWIDFKPQNPAHFKTIDVVRLEIATQSESPARIAECLSNLTAPRPGQEKITLDMTVGALELAPYLGRWSEFEALGDALEAALSDNDSTTTTTTNKQSSDALSGGESSPANSNPAGVKAEQVWSQYHIMALQRDRIDYAHLRKQVQHYLQQEDFQTVPLVESLEFANLKVSMQIRIREVDASDQAKKDKLMKTNLQHTTPAQSPKDSSEESNTDQSPAADSEENKDVAASEKWTTVKPMLLRRMGALGKMRGIAPSVSMNLFGPFSETRLVFGGNIHLRETPKAKEAQDKAAVNEDQSPKIEEEEAAINEDQSPKIEEEEAAVNEDQRPKIQEEEAAVSEDQSPKIEQDEEISQPAQSAESGVQEEEESQSLPKKQPQDIVILQREDFDLVKQDTTSWTGTYKLDQRKIDKANGDEEVEFSTVVFDVRAQITPLGEPKQPTPVRQP